MVRDVRDVRNVLVTHVASQRRARLRLGQHEELGEVGVPAGELSVNKLLERVAVLVAVEHANASEEALRTRRDPTDERGVVDAPALARLRQPLHLFAAGLRPSEAVNRWSCE